jgi:hypothetical protein
MLESRGINLVKGNVCKVEVALLVIISKSKKKKGDARYIMP